MRCRWRGNDAAGGHDTNTGLASTFTFFYGSAIGETAAGDGTTFAVNSIDEQLARNGANGIGPNSIISTVAGNGTAGYSGDNGPATSAQLNFNTPTGIAVDSAGDLFIPDTKNNRVREVNHATGVITTVAGNGTAGYSGDNGLATAAQLNNPVGVAVDVAGDIFIADSGNNVIREVNHATGVITTFAGTGTAGYAGDNGSATAAKMNEPVAVAPDSAGDLFVVDYNNNVVREIRLPPA